MPAGLYFFERGYCPRFNSIADHESQQGTRSSYAHTAMIELPFTVPSPPSTVTMSSIVYRSEVNYWSMGLLHSWFSLVDLVYIEYSGLQLKSDRHQKVLRVFFVVYYSIIARTM